MMVPKLTEKDGVRIDCYLDCSTRDTESLSACSAIVDSGEKQDER
jgi:hypothetical protein